MPSTSLETNIQGLSFVLSFQGHTPERRSFCVCLISSYHPDPTAVFTALGESHIAVKKQSGICRQPSTKTQNPFMLQICTSKVKHQPDAKKLKGKRIVLPEPRSFSAFACCCRNKTEHIFVPHYSRNELSSTFAKLLLYFRLVGIVLCRRNLLLLRCMIVPSNVGCWSTPRKSAD